MREMWKQNNFTFTMINDHGAKIAKKYNVYKFGKLIDIPYGHVRLALPSNFLINKEGNIVWQFIATRTKRPPLELLIKAIDENIKSPS